jgi:predicted RNA-binding Zn-ribbon protein involved in translation (DUF1610 family)
MTDFNPPSCFTQKTVKARKRHFCVECQTIIHPGEHHEVYSGIWDGTPDRHRTCLACVELRDLSEEWGFGELATTLGEWEGYHGPPPSDLRPKIKAFWHRYNIRSQCCSCSVRVWGKTTFHYRCDSCGEPCDVEVQP